MFDLFLLLINVLLVHINIIIPIYLRRKSTLNYVRQVEIILSRINARTETINHIKKEKTYHKSLCRLRLRRFFLYSGIVCCPMVKIIYSSLYILRQKQWWSISLLERCHDTLNSIGRKKHRRLSRLKTFQRIEFSKVNINYTLDYSNLSLDRKLPITCFFTR